MRESNLKLIVLDVTPIMRFATAPLRLFIELHIYASVYNTLSDRARRGRAGQQRGGAIYVVFA